MDSFKGYIHSFESFGSADGPGVRCVVFMQGCGMRCKYCHNPDTWEGQGEIYSPAELLEKVWKYRSYWGHNFSRGGVTVSGGEPLLQMDFVYEFFKLLKEKGIHTAIDTAGAPFKKDSDFMEKFDKLMSVTDLVLLDIKAFNEELHKSITGVSNKNILDMARYLSDIEKPVWLRHVLVPSLTDTHDELSAIADFAKTLKNVERVEILPYHTLGKSKWQKLGISYPLEGINPPSAEELKKAKEYFK